jgi:RNA polymerase sigma factor (sigma-70 family)
LDFEATTLPYLKALFRLALRLTGNPAAAEDMVQETYLRALQSFDSLRDPQRVRPWLFQILSRLVIDRHRTAWREARRSRVPRTWIGSRSTTALPTRTRSPTPTACTTTPLEALEKHLSDCLDCCDRLQFNRRLDAFVKARLGEASLPQGLEARLRRGLLRARVAGAAEES